MRRLVPLMLVALSACASAPNDSYSLGRGIASYDDLRRETQTCNARGGVIQPKSEGDPAQLSNYTCVITKGK